MEMSYRGLKKQVLFLSSDVRTLLLSNTENIMINSYSEKYHWLEYLDF